MKFYVLGKGIIVSLPRTVAWMVQAIESLTFSTNAAMPMEHTLHPAMGVVHSQRKDYIVAGKLYRIGS